MTEDIRKTMWDAMAESPLLMVKLDGSHIHAEPLTAQLDPDAHGRFWFYISRDNRIARGGRAMAQFVARDHSLFCCISGRLIEEMDPAVIDRYWTNMVAGWYEGGRNDPRLMMMRFELEDAEIWKPDNSLKGLFRLMSGKPDNPREMGRHEMVSLKRTG